MNHQKAWQTVLGQLQMEMPRASYDTWVRDTEALSYENGRLLVGTRNPYARDWLESRLASTVSRLLVGIMNRTVDVEFIVSEVQEAESILEEPPEDLEQEVESSTLDSPLITAISLEDHKLMDRVVVLPGYIKRLVKDIGVKGIWLYAAYKQAYFMAGVGQEGSEISRRVRAEEIIKWAIFSERTYWRILKQTIHLLDGLLERESFDAGTESYRRGGQTLRRRMPNQYRLFLTPRLARADAAFLFRLLKEEKSIEAGLRRLIRLSRKELMEFLPALDSEVVKVDGLGSMHFVADIVRALLGEEGPLPEELEQLSNKLHLKIIKLWGTMYLSHYFLYRLIPGRGLTPHQAWLFAVARDRAYLNSQTGEMRSEIRFPGGYEEMKALCGMSSWKGIAAWLRPYAGKRGGNLEPFMREFDSPDDKSYGKIGQMERRYWVQLDDEELLPMESSDSFLEESSDSFPEESSGSFGESNDSFPEESNDSFGTNAHIYVLKENTINTEKSKHKKPPPTRSSASQRKAGGGGKDFPSSGWDMNSLLKLNPGETPIVRKRIQETSNPTALVSWLLYAYSPEGEGIRSPSVFALSKLKNNPACFAPGVYEKLALLEPDVLQKKIQNQLLAEDEVERFFDRGQDSSGWAKTFRNVSDEALQELDSRLFRKQEITK